MRISRLLGTVAAGALLMSAPAALAQDAPFSFSGTVALTSDYIFRGVSQTLEDPAVQASLTVANDSGFFAGIWGSNVDFGVDEDIEIDYSVGFSNSVDNLAYTVGAYYYTYPGAPDALDYDYLEFGLNLSYTVDMVTPTASVYYSPDFFAGTGAAWYVTGGLAVAPTDIFKVYANIGLQTIDDVPDDVLDWNIGVSATWEALTFDLKYTDTDIDGLEIAEERIVGTVTFAF